MVGSSCLYRLQLHVAPWQEVSQAQACHAQ
jgi:hypothetical protein